MTVYALTKHTHASHHYPTDRTEFKGIYDSIEKAWEAIEHDYYPLLKNIEELKYKIRGVRINSCGLTIEYEKFFEDLYFCEMFDILETEVQ